MLSAVPENLQSELVSSARLRALYSDRLVWGGRGVRWGHHTPSRGKIDRVDEEVAFQTKNLRFEIISPVDCLKLICESYLGAHSQKVLKDF